MNPKVTTHPSVEELRAFSLGKTDTAAAETVAAHLATCLDCQKIVASLSGDSFTDRVKRAHPTVSLPTPDPLAATRDSVPDASAFPPPDLPPELARHPDYEVRRKLGEGGMGAVYLARNKLMDRLEVLKVVNQSLLGRAGATDRFLQEIRSAAKLQHPNVVTAYSASQMGALLVLAMEYVDGVDLAQLVRQKGPLPVAHACHYARQVALGLQRAFEQGMVHRDIKPNNLILGRKSEVKILDFGLAKVRQEEGDTGLTGTNVMMGTPDYMAPEQATDARNADIRADIYSLGCTLYYLLTGRPPFVTGSCPEPLLAHQTKRPEPVNKLRPEVPVELAAVVGRMLAKNPAERYQTPIEVARELLPFVKGGAKPAATAAPPPVPLSSPSAHTAGPRDTSASAPRPKLVTPTALEQPAQEILPPKQDSGEKRRPARPRAEKSKRPPGGGRKIGLWVAVAAAAAFGVFAALWLGGVLRAPGPIANAGKEGSLRPSDVLTLTLPKGVEMKFAWIPPGEFLMGSNRLDIEKPVHRVTLSKGFYMGVFTVTQSQWQAVMKNNPSKFRGDNRPVEQVSWDDCQKFCQELKKLTGKPVRLPTEAEWEYACRAGTTTEYNNGDGEDSLRKVGWYAGNSDSQTHPVGKLAPNAWGLYDMHGNVWQWCEDWYLPYPENNIKDLNDANFGLYRVLRGGFWNSPPAVGCRAAFRGRIAPAYRFGIYSCGCRVCFFLD